MGENRNEALILLKSIYKTIQTIKALQNEIERTYAMITSVTVKQKEVNVQTSKAGDMIAERLADIEEYKKQLEEHQRKLIKDKSKVFMTIKELSVDDQELLILRYLKALPVEKVAEEIDKSYYGTWKKLHKAEEHFCYVFKN